MLRRLRRWMASAGLVVMATIGWAVPPLAQGQEAAPPATTPRPPSRFVTVGPYRINPDQIAYVNQTSNPGEEPRVVIVFDGSRNELPPTGRWALDFLAILDGKGASQPASVPLSSRSPMVPGASDRKSAVLLRDDFDGNFALDWQTSRPDPTHTSVVKEPDTLTVTTQRGSIHGAQADDQQSDGLLARNLFLIATRRRLMPISRSPPAFTA